MATILLSACASTVLSEPPPTASPTPSDAGPTDAGPTDAPSAGPTDEAVASALETVMNDPEIAAFLDANSFTTEPPRFDSDTVHLLLRFDEPVPAGGIWDRTCEATDGEVSGAHFVINVAEGVVVDMSPRWGEESCIPLPDTDA